MYDELIGELYLTASTARSKSKRELIEKAADAIEELQRLLDGVSADNDSLCKQIDELQADKAALNGTVSNLIEQIAELSKRVPKSGVWREEESGYDDVYYECSVCGAGICTIDGDPVDNAWSYCPECGAKMTGVERLPAPPEEEEA